MPKSDVKCCCAIYQLPKNDYIWQMRRNLTKRKCQVRFKDFESIAMGEEAGAVVKQNTDGCCVSLNLVGKARFLCVPINSQSHYIFRSPKEYKPGCFIPY